MQLFQLDLCFMDVPVSRNVYFIATNQDHKPLVLNFNRPKVYFAEVRSKNGVVNPAKQC